MKQPRAEQAGQDEPDHGVAKLTIVQALAPGLAAGDPNPYGDGRGDDEAISAWDSPSRDLT